MIARETKWIFCIGIGDLLFTLWAVCGGHAEEANPIAAAFLSRGVACFVLFKASMLLVPLYILEWARRYNPVFVRACSRVCAFCYLFWLVGVTVTLHGAAFAVDWWLSYKGI